MRYSILLISMFLVTAAGFAQQPGDLFYVPKKHATQAPALIITSCTGATQADIDSNKSVADSFGWILATCAKTKNHQDAALNDQYVMATYQSLIAKYQIDKSRVYIYGFSGQAVQALMEVFLHPELLRGAVAICAHAGAVPLAQWEMLTGHGFYLISRQKDWNLKDNKKMHQLLQANGLRDTLVITPGQHGPKDRRELFKGCKWLDKNFK
jgi:predicted esterase